MGFIRLGYSYTRINQNALKAKITQKKNRVHFSMYPVLFLLGLDLNATELK